MLNNIAMLSEYVKANVHQTTRYLLFFSNVGKSAKGDVFVSTPRNPGNHWTLLVVDLAKNKWMYCDTSCWSMPTNLKAVVNPFVTAVYVEVLKERIKSPCVIAQSHVSGRSSTHICSKQCYKNIPLQTCSNVCGVGVIIIGGIISSAPELWENVFSKREDNLPRHFNWVINLSDNSDFLRITVISWLLKGSIDVSLIGINQLKGSIAQKPSQPSTSRTRNVVNIDLTEDGAGLVETRRKNCETEQPEKQPGKSKA